MFWSRPLTLDQSRPYISMGYTYSVIIGLGRWLTSAAVISPVSCDLNTGVLVDCDVSLIWAPRVMGVGVLTPRDSIPPGILPGSKTSLLQYTCTSNLMVDVCGLLSGMECFSGGGEWVACINTLSIYHRSSCLWNYYYIALYVYIVIYFPNYYSITSYIWYKMDHHCWCIDLETPAWHWPLELHNVVIHGCTSVYTWWVITPPYFNIYIIFIYI